MTDEWLSCSQAPEGVEVLTKIDDAEHGVRNVTTLVKKGNFWFVPDMSMYVYYKPTHFQYI